MRARARRLRLVVGGVVAVLTVSLAAPGAAGASTAPWTADTVPTPRYEVGVFADVSCAGASFCLAVGNGAADSSGDVPGLTARWDGSTWTAVALPRLTGLRGLTGVSCPDAADCVAVGNLADGVTALRFDGMAWTSIAPTPPASVTFPALNAVDCVAPADCTAVGVRSGVKKPLLMHWDGTGWTVTAATVPSDDDTVVTDDVACASTTCFAVGRDDTRQVLLEGDGQQWRVVPLSGRPVGVLTGISCGGPTSCVAVGREVASRGVDPEPTVLSWDGTDWTVVDVPSPGVRGGSELFDVSCEGATACTAVGHNIPGSGVPASAPFVERFEGTSWTLSAFATPTAPQLFFVPAVACSGGACVAVGEVGDSTSGARTMAQVEDGTGWRIVPTPDRTQTGLGGVLSIVSCHADDACAAIGTATRPVAGSDQLLERWNGVRWTPTTLDLPFTPTLISCGSASRCLTAGPTRLQADDRRSAVVDAGVATVQPIVRPATGLLFARGLSCPSARSCLLTAEVSSSGGQFAPLVERWTPAGWRIVAAPPVTAQQRVELGYVSCVSDSWCLAVGDATNLTTGRGSGYAAIWNGTSWRRTSAPVGTPGSQALRVSCASSTFCAALGSQVPATWDGAQWHRGPAAPTDGALLDVSCGSVTSCTVVGRQQDVDPTNRFGVPFAESWDGTRWTPDTSPPPGTRPLTGVSCHDVCRAVGTSPLVVSRRAA